MLDTLSKITGLHSPKPKKFRHNVSVGAASASDLFHGCSAKNRHPHRRREDRATQNVCGLRPAEGELDSSPARFCSTGNVPVRWYEANGYVNPRRAKRINPRGGGKRYGRPAEMKF